MSVSATAVVMALVGVGAFVQGSIGFGFTFIVVPVLVLDPAALPAALLFLTLPLTAAMVVREHAAIDFSGFFWVLGGRIPGTILGVWVLAVVAPSSLSVLLGAIILLSVALSLVTTDVRRGRPTQLLAGVVPGFSGTAAAVGAPALALAYQDRRGPQFRSTLALTFLLGGILSLSALAVAGKVEAWQAVFALKLLPALVVGVWSSRFAFGRSDGRRLRPVIVAFAAVCGAAAVVKGLA